MLIVISPAKTLDYESPLPTEQFTQPELLEEAQSLIYTMRNYSPEDIGQLMGVSEKIAQLNFERFGDWQPPFTPDNARQALLAFKGDVYEGINAYDLSEDDLLYAQDHLRMLSGLYGLLKPLDLMQPYRLEMGTKVDNDRGKNLYEFWGNIITDKLNEALESQGDEVLVNLASNEYFKSVKKKALKARIITPAFKDWKNGQYKMISFYAKRARGMMSRYIIENRLTNPEDLKKFDVAGYAFDPELSGKDDWVFTRKQD